MIEKFDEAMFSTALTIIDNNNNNNSNNNNNNNNTEQCNVREKQDTSASRLVLDEWGKYKLNLYLLQEDTSMARYIQLPVVPSTFWTDRFTRSLSRSFTNLLVTSVTHIVLLQHIQAHLSKRRTILEFSCRRFFFI